MTDLLLPIFPLGVVLFPGTRLPLHLFEPRYRQLLADVQSGNSRFAILTAMAGVAESDLPAGRVGCIAEVVEADIMPDGRAKIVIVGRERFTFTGYVERDTPYRVATGTLLPDEPGASPVALAVGADDVLDQFKRIVAAVRTLNNDNDPPPVIDEPPAQIAWTIGAMIDIDLESRYRLLAERSPTARLTQIDHVLRRALPDLELRAAMHRG